MVSTSKLPSVWHLLDSLRSGEFTWETWDATSSAHHLARQHIEFINDSVNLTLPASKTDPFRNGVVIHLAQTASPLCPVRALTRLFQEYPRQKSEPFFTRTVGPFNRQYIVDKIKELLLQAGISTFGFSGHSIRKGRQSQPPPMAYPRKTSNYLGDGKAMLSTHTSMNYPKPNNHTNYYPSIPNYTLSQILPPHRNKPLHTTLTQHFPSFRGPSLQTHQSASSQSRPAPGT